MTVAERAYGLVIKPTFSDAWDTARKPLRMPIPPRTATTEAQSVYRAHMLEMARLGTAAQMRVLSYQMGDDTLPVSALDLGPSTAATDPMFDRMNTQAQQHHESSQDAMLRRHYEAEATARMEGQRVGDLSSIYAQGLGHSVIEGERGSAALEQYRIDSDEETVSPKSAIDTSPQPRITGVRHGVATHLPLTSGRVPQPQLRSFREINFGQQAPTSAAATVREGEDESYESMRLHRVTNAYLRK